ncbi:MAG: hypothetical protein ACLFO2_02725 [Candidatus Woesearchaeota archaeon]
MPTKYNIEIKPVIDPRIDEDTALASLVAAKDFLGEKHVNHFGRAHPGRDEDCKTNYVGTFDIFYRPHEYSHRLLQEYKRQLLLLNSEEQDGLEEILAIAQPIQEKLEQADVNILFNKWDNYMNSKIPSHFAIRTPAGVQDSHVHLDNHHIIQFWKPAKDEHWYDYDDFRAYLWRASTRILQIEESLYKENPGWEQRKSLKREYGKARKALKYFPRPEEYEKVRLPDDAPTFNI